TVLARRLALKIDYNGPLPMDLLEGIGRVVANRNDKAEKIRTVLRKLGKRLDEVEGPAKPFFSLRSRFIVQAVVPCLQLIEDERCLLLGEHVLEQGFCRNEISGLLKLTAIILPLGMTSEEQVPKIRVLLI